MEGALQVRLLARRLPEWFNAQGLEEIARDLRAHEGWVAVRGRRVVGWAMWAPEGERGASLSWIGVEKGEHWHGIGTALLAALEGRLRALGKESLFVSTVAPSVDYEPYARARAFYRASGFADFRVDRGHFKDPRGDYDRLLLRKAIGGPGAKGPR